MPKKISVTVLFMLVFAGLVLFAYSQVVAQPPTDSARIIECPNGEMLKLHFDPITGALTLAEYCDGSTGCTWENLQIRTGYVCNNADKDDCRLIQGAELGYFCGSIGGYFGGSYIRKSR